MEKSKERKFMCKFCSKKFPSGKSLGGHIRIHTNENSVDSDRYNGNRLREKPKKNKISALKQEQLVRCRECDKEFDSLKALCNHSEREKIVMDSQSDTETSSSPTRKRSKRVIKQSNSESFSYGSSFSASEIEQEHKHMALSLMMMSRDHSFKNSVAESSENNSVILETKSCSGEHLKMFDAGDDNAYDSASDYFMNGPKKSGSDISVDGSLRNNSLKRFRNSGEGGSKYELRKSKRVFFSSYETDSCAETNSMVKKASGAKKKSKLHHCPICSRVFKSGQALGGHKRSHFIGNQEHVAEMHSDPIDLNLPAPDIDE